VLIGGTGSDVFEFDRNDGRDLIADWRDGVDRIDVTDFGFASAAAVIALGAQDGDDVVFELGSGTSFVVRDAVLRDFDGSDVLI
jgi:hypothetical protein